MISGKYVVAFVLSFVSLQRIQAQNHSGTVQAFLPEIMIK
jgi:hypothetical protein